MAIGDELGVIEGRYQPMKIAAAEAQSSHGRGYGKSAFLAAWATRKIARWPGCLWTLSGTYPGQGDAAACFHLDDGRDESARADQAGLVLDPPGARVLEPRTAALVRVGVLAAIGLGRLVAAAPGVADGFEYDVKAALEDPGGH